MSWVAVGVGGATLLGSYLQSNAATGAAQTQANAAGQSGQLGAGMFTQNQANLSPYLNSGTNNLNYLNYLLGVPGYNTPTGGQAANQGNLPLNPQTGKPYDFTSFLAYDQAGDPNIGNAYRDAQTQYNQYLSGGLTPTGSIPAVQGQMPPGGMPAGNVSQMGGVPGQQSAAGTMIQPLSGAGTPAQAMGGAGQPGGFGSLTQPFGLAQFQASPAYQFNLQQGQQAINKAAAARGNYYAPQTLQDIAGYSQGLASNEYQTALQNYTQQQQQVYNMLSGGSQQGLQAGGALGGVSVPFAQLGSQAITGAGNALAAGQVGSANAYTNATNNLTNPALLQLLMNQNQNQNQLSGFDMSQYAAG